MTSQINQKNQLPSLGALQSAVLWSYYEVVERQAVFSSASFCIIPVALNLDIFTIYVNI